MALPTNGYAYGRMSARSIAGYTALLFLLIYLLPLSMRPIISPDESRYGAIALEMLHTKDWWSMKLVGLSYYEKPPLGYWCTAISMAIFGENAWALRLPAALAALVTAIATGQIAARICKIPNVGGVTSVVQLSMLFPWVFGSVAILDGIFTAFITVCVAFFVYAATDRVKRWRMFFLAISGVAAAGAFLTKGFLGLAFPAIIAGGWLIWQKRWRDLFVLPLVPIASAAMIAAPLIIQIDKHNSGFWNYFFWVEHIRRFTSPDSNQHPESWWYFLPMIPVGALLWSINIGKIWNGFRQTMFCDRGVSLCAIWIALPLLLLSASSGKLPAYILPIFPAISIIITVTLLSYFSSSTLVTSWHDQLGRQLLILIALMMASLIVTGQSWVYADPLWHSNSQWRVALLSLALFTWAGLDSWAHRAQTPIYRLWRMAFSPTPMLMMISLLFPTALIERSRTAVESLANHANMIAQAGTIIADSSMATSVAYTTKRFDMYFIAPGGELNNELEIPEEKARFISQPDLLAHVAQKQAHGSVVLIMTHNNYKLFHALGAPKPISEFIDGDVSVALFAQVK
ncbi:MAG: hypothetical protein EXS12_02940 [Phycisphaerales bacterium]|nr:hypothetical protein [Phycisphaerales bacterium]